ERVQRLVLRRVLLAAVAHEVHRTRLVVQALEVQRDAHAIGSTGTPVAVEHQAGRHERSPPAWIACSLATSAAVARARVSSARRASPGRVCITAAATGQ